MTEQQQQFFRLAVPAAIASARATGVPASVTIAQAALESAWGRDAPANNYFGVKAEHLRDPETYVVRQTHEVIDGKPIEIKASFERYASPAASFVGHGHLLATARRYTTAMAVRDNPLAFCHELQRCGYATDPNYAHSLIDLIEEYNLTQYDHPPEPAALSSAA